MNRPNYLAGIAAGRMPEFIEMMQVCLSIIGLAHKSGTRLNETNHTI